MCRAALRVSSSSVCHFHCVCCPRRCHRRHSGETAAGILLPEHQLGAVNERCKDSRGKRAVGPLQLGSTAAPVHLKKIKLRRRRRAWPKSQADMIMHGRLAFWKPHGLKGKPASPVWFTVISLIYPLQIDSTHGNYHQRYETYSERNIQSNFLLRKPLFLLFFLFSFNLLVFLQQVKTAPAQMVWKHCPGGRCCSLVRCWLLQAAAQMLFVFVHLKHRVERHKHLIPQDQIQLCKRGLRVRCPLWEIIAFVSMQLVKACLFFSDCVARFRLLAQLRV